MVESPTKYPNVKNKPDMIDYLLNLDSIMNRKRQRSENQLIEEEEDSKIDNSNLFSDLVQNNKKVANRNLLELNGYKEQSSSSQSQS